MTEAGDQVAVVCPACSPHQPTLHEALTNGAEPTVRCRECRHVHSARVESTAEEQAIRTIVSQGAESITATVELPADATAEVGQELVVETADAIYTVEVTSLEDDAGGRHDKLPIAETSTLWTRDVGNVAVDVTIHPPSNTTEGSRSTVLRVPGDDAFTIGEEATVDGEPVRVHGIHLRQPTEADGLRKLNQPGDTALARDIARLYVTSRRTVRRSPW